MSANALAEVSRSLCHTSSERRSPPGSVFPGAVYGSEISSARGSAQPRGAPPAAVGKPCQHALTKHPAPNPHVCHTGRQCRRRHREGVIIARLELRLHLHVAGGVAQMNACRSATSGWAASFAATSASLRRTFVTHSPMVCSVPANPAQAWGTSQTRPDTLLRSIG